MIRPERIYGQFRKDLNVPFIVTYPFEPSFWDQMTTLNSAFTFT